MRPPDNQESGAHARLQRDTRRDMSSCSILKLSCSVQTYAWGKIGLDSEVARLRQKDPKFVFQAESPYAEVFIAVTTL